MKRVLLKLSGEALGKPGLDRDAIRTTVSEIIAARETGTQIALVSGGGNLLRGRDLDLPTVRRPVRDRMGMLATIINCLALTDSLIEAGCPAKLFVATPMPGVARISTARSTRRAAQ